MSMAQRYGDLELSFVAAEGGAGIGGDVGIYTAFPEGSQGSDLRDFLPSGHKLGPRDMAGKAGVLMLKDLSPDKQLLRPPDRWEWINYVGAIPGIQGAWRPVPPPGYVALGDIIAHTDPDLHGPDIWTACVKEEPYNGHTYVTEGECGTLLYSFLDVNLLSVVAPSYPDGDLDEHLYLPCGNFTHVATDSATPGPTATTWILDLPAVVEKHDGPEAPVLTSHDRPPLQTAIIDRTVTVPYYLIDDKNRDEKWKMENSPFYTIRRKRHYELVLHRDNRNGSTEQQESQSITTGVTVESSESFSETTGMQVGTSVGVTVSALPFGMGAETSVTNSVSTSTELGYERRTGIAIMREETKTRGLNIPAHSSGCLWTEHHELLPVRADGKPLSNQANLGFGTVFYTTGEYPEGAGVTTFEEEADGTRVAMPSHHLAPDTRTGRPENADSARAGDPAV
ncbi:hypothetical protein [Streptomyces griseus]|uniref:hypothetical protein n=1 Tax=Streptomyces griseus TaxID=1911 RepID=UPI00083FE1E7|nr:hypothetical protein [Streptomyces griseus]